MMRKFLNANSPPRVLVKRRVARDSTRATPPISNLPAYLTYAYLIASHAPVPQADLLARAQAAELPRRSRPARNSPAQVAPA